MKYIVYSEDGCILRTGSTPDDDLSLQAGDNEFVIEGVADDEEHYVCDGKVVKLPEKPSSIHKFDYKNRVWYDPRSLQEIKDLKWDEIKKAKEAFFDKPLVTEWGTFDSKSKDRDKLFNIANMARIPVSPTFEFTLADNTTITLLPNEMVKVSILLWNKIQEGHLHSQAIRYEIDQATTKEQVDRIEWGI